jgi:hypothetical protein
MCVNLIIGHNIAIIRYTARIHGPHITFESMEFLDFHAPSYFHFKPLKMVPNGECVTMFSQFDFIIVFTWFYRVMS